MVKEISPEELKEMIKSEKDLQLIDVRESYEFEENHIDEAKLIPLGQIQSRIGEVDKNKPVVFICRSGARSRMATQFADSTGYTAYNLSGGMLDWSYLN